MKCADSRLLLLLPWYKTFHLNEQVQSFFQYYIYIFPVNNKDENKSQRKNPS